MTNLLEGYIEKVMQKQPFFKIMMCEQVINKNPVIIQLINDSKKRNAEAISKLIRDGQAKGVFKKEVDILMLINSLTGSVTQTMLTKDYYKEYYGLQSIPEDQFVDQLKQKLRNHINFLFKALLSYEA